MVRWLSLFFGIAVGVAIFAGWKWYSYVTNTVTPFDAEGIQLNGVVPAPLNAWGCGRLRATFPQSFPPDNCKAPDGGWSAPATVR